MLSVTSAAALVAGSALEEQDMASVRIKALRAFMPGKNVEGRAIDKPVKVGEVVTVPKLFALELIAAKKAEIASDEPQKEAEKPKAEGKGGKKDAQ